jgi:DNA-binding winged helix-turn-helix (wHTH) protein
MNMGLLSPSYGQEAPSIQHNMVVMRMIGHKILLNFGDSTSRILPIQRDGNRYKIQFENEFGFNPDNMVKIIDSVVQNGKIANHYLVEVGTCESEEVVYSYEMGIVSDSDLVPCSKRDYPKACYNFFITILTPGIEETKPGLSLDYFDGIKESGSKTENAGQSISFLWMIPILMIIGIFFFYQKKKNVTDSDLISIGKFQFDPRNMMLLFEDSKEELTGKEADLLEVLYLSSNVTLDREMILKSVWGDEGDYVGRTLDVFISKLRKKLDKDPNIKIINIRGVGYKLVLNV